MGDPVVALLDEPLPQGRFVPEPWPVVPPLEEVPVYPHEILIGPQRLGSTEDIIK